MDCFTCKLPCDSSNNVTMTDNCGLIAVLHQDFCVNCRGCNMPVSQDDLSTTAAVMVPKSGPIHMACFTCKACTLPISVMKGEQFLNSSIGHIHTGCLKCHVCCEIIVGHYAAREGKLLCKEHSTAEIAPKEDKEDKENTSKAGRQKRTNIKGPQLDILTRSFNDNFKPNRRMRDQLVKETGLPSRTIQIWFQNRRAKQGRMVQQSIKMQEVRRYHNAHYMHRQGPPNATVLQTQQYNPCMGQNFVYNQQQQQQHSWTQQDWDLHYQQQNMYYNAQAAPEYSFPETPLPSPTSSLASTSSCNQSSPVPSPVPQQQDNTCYNLPAPPGYNQAFLN